MPDYIPWIGSIPLFPLVTALVIAFIKPQWGRAAGGLALLGLGMALDLSLFAFKVSLAFPGVHVANFTWFQVGGCSLDFGFILDPLSASMLAMVSVISFLIFFYSTSYMAEDPDRSRFFCYLSLFASGMLGLIISNSILLLFMCWEIVGLSSYLLIGFWYKKPAAAAAAKKAFITTRIGDLGLFIGILWVFKETGTLLFYNNGAGLLENAQVVRMATIPSPLFHLSVLGAISLLIFVGAAGKSGQVPFHVWLPDAMEGPTPVSALIHAATMVAAGVFLVARAYPLFHEDTKALTNTAWVGAVTTLFAGIIAIGQHDLKRVLAYSTVSQLGMMMLGIGVAGVGPGMFHLLSHAFFKALLFLGAGSIIHGCHGEQDIRKLGGVWRSMPLTSACFLCGTLALCAIPPTSGFFSKDEILLAAWNSNKIIFTMGALAAFCTSLYMTRVFCYVFLGTPRSHGQPHESPWPVTAPLVILALFAIGFGGIAKYLGILDYISSSDSLADSSIPEGSGIVTAISCIVAFGGVFVGYLIYGRRALKANEPDAIGRAVPAVYSVLEHRGYFDELYAATIFRLWKAFALIAELIDAALLVLSEAGIYLVRVVSGFFAFRSDDIFINRWSFDGMCSALRGAGFLTTRSQNGLLTSYLRLIALGTVVLGLLFWWSAR